MRPSRRQSPPFVRRWPAGPPSVTTLLIALSFGAYAAQCIVALMLVDQDPRDILRTWLALDVQGIHAGQYWRILTFGFLHAGPWPLYFLGHIAANMTLLYFAGREVEPIVGPRHFLAIYLAGNVIGGVANSLLLVPGYPVVGVSAGVAAVIVAFTTILPELEVPVQLFYVLPVRLKARHLAIALMGANLLFCLTRNLETAVIGPAGILAASVFSWAYVKQLGFGNPLPIQRYIFEKRQRAARLSRMSPSQFLRTEVDPILEKIAREGIKSLSRSERKILNQGREKMLGGSMQKRGR